MGITAASEGKRRPSLRHSVGFGTVFGIDSSFGGKCSPPSPRLASPLVESPSSQVKSKTVLFLGRCGFCCRKMSSLVETSSSSSSSSSSVLRDLYGGAITANLGQDFQDVSNLRPVPDYQVSVVFYFFLSLSLSH
jgi:hypothetical protein